MLSYNAHIIYISIYISHCHTADQWQCKKTDFGNDIQLKVLLLLQPTIPKLKSWEENALLPVAEELIVLVLLSFI